MQNLLSFQVDLRQRSGRGLFEASPGKTSSAVS